MPMVRRICRPGTSVPGVFEDFSIRVVFLFGLYSTYGIAATPARPADWYGC